MPKSKYTHISTVMDRSGSMSGIARDMEGGLREFIDAQKAVEGEATLTLARFDDTYEVVYDFVPLSQATSFTLDPRGSTALLDAMGRTMESVRASIHGMTDEERPEKSIFIFVTDGGENASREYNRQRIFDMIRDLRNSENDVNRPDENGTVWEFVFLGANQDAISEGGGYGIRAASSMTYDASAQGSRAMFASLTNNMTAYRSKSVDNATLDFSQEDRDAQGVTDSATNVSKSSRSMRNMGPIPSLYGTKLCINDAGEDVTTETTETK